MSAYSKIYAYLEESAGKRANILPGYQGGWVLNGGHSLYSGVSKAITTLIMDKVPDGAQVDNMWLWLFDGKMKFSYSVPSGSLFTVDLIPGNFEEGFS